MSTMDRVAYKPLGTSSNIENDIVDGDPDLKCDLDEPFSSPNLEYLEHTNIIHRFFSHTNLHRLRMIIYFVAIILTFIFVVQLLTNQNGARSVNIQTTGDTSTRNEKSPLETSKFLQSTTTNLIESHKELLHPRKQFLTYDNRPQYDSYLSSVLQDRNLQNLNSDYNREILDDLSFPIDGHYSSSSSSSSSTSQRSNIWWTLNYRDKDKYLTLTNYIRALKSFTYNTSITLTTQATTDFIYHTLELCRRWDGPISIAVFSPGPELIVSTTLIKYMRQCLPAPLSACIKDKVTWHLVYNKLHGPSSSDISYPRFYLDSKNYPLFVDQDQCPKLPGPEPEDSIKQFEIELRKSNKIFPTSYRQQFHLPYPINVLRNTARLAAGTRYILASDIELYPSINLAPSFINFITRHNLEIEYNFIKKFSFILPIFEVESHVTAPKTKKELINLLHRGEAIFFHKWVCSYCQDFPNRMDWLRTVKYGHQDFTSDDEVVVFEVAQRNKSRDSWEPIFIGTNDDPLYDDRLTWDGRRDKMGQMYEMCLQDYYLLVLGNAFLVHAPGIKHMDRNETMKRLKYIRENNAIYDETIAKLREQYSDKSTVHKC